MLRTIGVVLAVVLLAVSPAAAHGGGGYVYVPVFVYNGPPVVPDARTGDYSNIHSVAIISAVGQTMILGRSGWLVSHSTVDISDMKLDDFVDSALRLYLPSRFKIVDVPYDRAKLAGIPNGIDDVSTDALRAYLTALPAQGVDAFVVVRPDGEAGGANTPGLSLNGGNGVDVRPDVDANFEIDIVDAKTGKTIGHALSRIQPRKGTNPYFASMFGPVDLKIEPDQIPTDAQRIELKAQFQKLLSNALIETLRPLNLGLALPEPGARVMMPLPDNLRPKFKNVAIVSAVGDSMELEHRGAFFVHEINTAPIADWNVDSEVEAEVAAALDKHIAVKTIAVDRAKIAKQDFAVADSTINTPVDGLVATSDIDAYIVIVKVKGNDPFFGEEGPGLGMHHLTPVGADDQTGVFAFYAIALVDPHTLKPFLIVRAVTSPERPTQEVSASTDNTDWPEKSVFTPEQVSAVHKTLSMILSDSISETMMRMRLTGTMPSGELPSVPAPAAQPAPAPQPIPPQATPPPPLQKPAQ